MTDNEIIKALEPYIEGLQRAAKGFFLRVDDKQEIEVLEKVTQQRLMTNCPACFIRVIRAAVSIYNKAKENLQQTGSEQSEQTEQKEGENVEKTNKRAGKGNASKKKSVPKKI